MFSMQSHVLHVSDLAHTYWRVPCIFWRYNGDLEASFWEKKHWKRIYKQITVMWSHQIQKPLPTCVTNFIIVEIWFVIRMQLNLIKEINIVKKFPTFP
jgi:hypothetical protein